MTLIYLSRQLGHNTAMMRANASSGRVERDYQVVQPISRQSRDRRAVGEGLSSSSSR